MKLKIIDTGKGKVPSTVMEGWKLCSMYDMANLVSFLETNKGSQYEVKNGEFAFAFCEDPGPYKKTSKDWLKNKIKFYVIKL